MNFVNFYAGSVLDRCHERRTDNGYLKEAVFKKATKYILFQKCNPLFMGKDAEKNLVVLSCEDVKSFVDFNMIEEKWPCNLLFLGRDPDEINWFGVNIHEDGIRDELLIGDRFFAQGFHQGLQLSWNESAFVSQAQGMFQWHDRYRFCPTCGAHTFVEEAGYKRTCVDKECRSNKGIHNTCYPRTDPVAIMNVISKDGDKCLLGRKKAWPKKVYSCLAGFLEPGESIEDGVKRETKEESGITVDDVHYISSQPWPYPSCLMLGCQATANTEEIHVNKEELEDAKWFHIDILRKASKGNFEELIFPPQQTIAGQLIRQWIKSKETTSSL